MRSKPSAFSRAALASVVMKPVSRSSSSPNSSPTCRWLAQTQATVLPRTCSGAHSSERTPIISMLSLTPPGCPGP